MKRYVRLYLYFLQFSFSKAFQFRLDFFFRIFMDLLFYIIQFLFFDIIFQHTDLLGSWNIGQIRIFISTYILLDALHMTIFANNCWHFPFLINSGDIDYYLTKPVSSLFFLSLKEFAANSFVNLLMAMGIFSYFFLSYTESFSIFDTLMFILLILNGTYLYFLVHLMFLLNVFWTGADRGFGDLFFTATKVLERPITIFSSKLRILFLTLLPFGVMTSLPVHYILNDSNYPRSIILAYCILSTVVMNLIVVFTWKKGLENYSSASS